MIDLPDNIARIPRFIGAFLKILFVIIQPGKLCVDNEANGCYWDFKEILGDCGAYYYAYIPCLFAALLIAAILGKKRFDDGGKCGLLIALTMTCFYPLLLLCDPEMYSSIYRLGFSVVCAYSAAIILISSKQSEGPGLEPDGTGR